MGNGPERKAFLVNTARLAKATFVALDGALEDPSSLSIAQMRMMRRRLLRAGQSLEFAIYFPQIPPSAQRIIDSGGDETADQNFEYGSRSRDYWLAILEPKPSGDGLQNITNMQIVSAGNKGNLFGKSENEIARRLDKSANTVSIYRRHFKAVFTEPPADSHHQVMDAHARALETLTEARLRWPEAYPPHVTDEQMASIIAGGFTISKSPTGEIVVIPLEKIYTRRGLSASIPSFARQRVPFVPLRPPAPETRWPTKRKGGRAARQAATPKLERPAKPTKPEPVARLRPLEQNIVYKYFNPAELLIIGTAIVCLNQEKSRRASQLNLRLTREGKDLFEASGKTFATRHRIQPVDLQVAKGTIIDKMNKLLNHDDIRREMANVLMPDDLRLADFQSLVFTLIGTLTLGQFILLRNYFIEENLPVRKRENNCEPQAAIAN